VKLKTLGIYQGIIFTIIFGAFSFITWSRGVDTYIKFGPYILYGWGGLTLVIPVLVGVAYCQITKPKELTFTDALQFAFLTYVIYEVGYATVNVVLSNFLDKGFNHATYVTALHNDIADAIKLGKPADGFNKELAFENAHPSGPYTFIQVILSLGQGLIWGFMKAMLVAIVIRKRPRGPKAPGDPQKP